MELPKSKLKYAEGLFSDIWIQVDENRHELFTDIDDLKTGTLPNGKQTAAIYLDVHPEHLGFVHQYLKQNNFYFHHYSSAKTAADGTLLRQMGRYIYCYNATGKAQSYATSIQGVSLILKTMDNMFVGVLERNKLKGISGALDIGESLPSTIIEELREEIGLTLQNIVSGTLFKYGGHVQHNARDDLINDNMGKYVLTLDISSTYVQQAFKDAGANGTLDEEVTGIVTVPVTGPFTKDHVTIIDPTGKSIPFKDGTKTWLLDDLTTLFKHSVPSASTVDTATIPCLVASIDGSGVKFTPGFLSVPHNTAPWELQA
jgi:hypothetical protein